jgi:hypothetical protein
MNFIILLLICIPVHFITTKGIRIWDAIRIKLNSDYQNLKYISDNKTTLTKDKIVEISSHSNSDFDKDIERYDMFYFNPGIVDNFKEFESYQKLVNNYRRLFFRQCLLIFALFVLIWLTGQSINFLLGSSFHLY